MNVSQKKHKHTVDTHWGRCSCLFDSSPLFYLYTMALPQSAPNGTEESTCLSRAYCISLHCLSPYLSLPPLYSPSIPTAINLSLHPSILNTWFGWELCTSLRCCVFLRLSACGSQCTNLKIHTHYWRLIQLYTHRNTRTHSIHKKKL